MYEAAVGGTRAVSAKQIRVQIAFVTCSFMATNQQEQYIW